ncbi:MAG: hemerythrin family protein [Deltaproteobacteria bacterium]|nr:hemerythrin family protein [Deltaproteobacteria bacterium]
MDDQHKSLIEKVNELREAMKVGEGKEKMASLMRFLGDYAMTHFSTEERLMEHHKYPKFAEHKKIHDDFKADFLRLSQELSKATRASLMSIEVERRLSDWLVQHIQNRDKEAGAYLMQKGVR